MALRLKRAYDPASSRDGQRILVDRIWPRGVTKEEAKITRWLKELAPSTGLRKWFAHDPAKWAEFKRRYRQELGEQEGILADIAREAGHRTITLVYAARDERYNNAVALKEFLEEKS